MINSPSKLPDSLDMISVSCARSPKFFIVLLLSPSPIGALHNPNHRTPKALPRIDHKHTDIPLSRIFRLWNTPNLHRRSILLPVTSLSQPRRARTSPIDEERWRELYTVQLSDGEVGQRDVGIAFERNAEGEGLSDLEEDVVISTSARGPATAPEAGITVIGDFR